MPDAVQRFSGFADDYDSVRPVPPTEIVDLLCQYSGSDRPTVVDLGAGTGLSTTIWASRAAKVIAVEPNEDMRSVAAQRFAGTDIEVVDATAEHTGLPDGIADIVTASQAMHWFDPSKVLPEIARLLRPGGVFAAVDCDWPPTIHPTVDAAYTAAEQVYRGLEPEQRVDPRRTEKEGHLARITDSGLFTYTRETVVHKRDHGDAERLVGLIDSQGGIVALKKRGFTDDDLQITALRAAAEAHVTAQTPWWWTYRVRLGVR